MLDSDLIDAALLTRGQVQMLGLQEPLMKQRLLDVILVEFQLTWMLEQVLIQVLHYTVLNALAVECPLVLLLVARLPIGLRRKNLHKRLCHFGHEFLHSLALLLSRAIILNNLWQGGPDKQLNGLPDRSSLLTLQLLIKTMKYTLRSDAIHFLR